MQNVNCIWAQTFSILEFQSKGTGCWQKLDSGKVLVNPTTSCFYCCSVCTEENDSFLQMTNHYPSPLHCLSDLKAWRLGTENSDHLFLRTAERTLLCLNKGNSADSNGTRAEAKCNDNDSSFIHPRNPLYTRGHWLFLVKVWSWISLIFR